MGREEAVGLVFCTEPALCAAITGARSKGGPKAGGTRMRCEARFPQGTRSGADGGETEGRVFILEIRKINSAKLHEKVHAVSMTSKAQGHHPR